MTGQLLNKELSNLEATRFELLDNIAIITLNRPESANSLDTTMHRDLAPCWEEVNANDAIRAAIVTGEGRFFCAGRDIKEFLTTYDGEERKLRPLDDPEHPLFGKFAHTWVLQKPLIGALNGGAVGAGLQMVLLCDMIVMSERAYIADLHAKVNLAAVLTPLLKVLPPMIARELMMTDKRLTAEECLRWGFANYVVPHDKLLEKALELARSVTQMGPDAIKNAKQASLKLQVDSGTISLEDNLEKRREAARQRLANENNQRGDFEGMRAFAERRDASFTNRPE